ncbi:MAG TPA: hypothetical protein VL551_11755 [Actinospica sp.]|jgi:hypothetical protein|nr:hypothetical protein [Actinospica sp.]
MPHTLQAFHQAEQRHQEQAGEVIALATRTLAAMFPAAAYVWLDGDDPGNSATVFGLIALLDERGAVQHRFTADEHLPGLPGEFDADWEHVDYRVPETIRAYLLSAADAGAELADLPDELCTQHGEHVWMPVLDLRAV